MTLFSKKYALSLMCASFLTLSNVAHAEMTIVKFNSNQNNTQKNLTASHHQNQAPTNINNEVAMHSQPQQQNLQLNKMAHVATSRNYIDIPEHQNNPINHNRQLTQSEQKYYENLDTLVNSLVLSNQPINNRQPQFSYNMNGNRNGTTFIRPVNYQINSRYGMRKHPVFGNMKMHTGVDFAAPKGTPIRAAQNGVVVFSGTKGGYGNAVILQHDQRYSSLYGHASKLLVNTGQVVKQGQFIALVGDTGVATGPHLHFEIFEYGKRINPEPKINSM